MLDYPISSQQSGSVLEGFPLLDFREFVVASIVSLAPDVIRISNTHAALFLPVIGDLVNVRCAVIEASPGLLMEEFFLTHVWNVKYLSVGCGRAAFRRTILVANRR